MNHTNRFLNRTLLLVIGLIFFAAGAGVVALFAWPAAAQWWAGASADAQTWLDEANNRTMIGDTTLSWVTAGSLAAIVLLIVLLIVVLARLGGGRTHSLIRTGGKDSPNGRIIIDTGFAADALRQSLDQRPEILFSNVSAANIDREPLMHLSVTPRQNTSPRQVADDLDQLLNNLAVLTGEQMPTYVSIHTGLRSRLAHDQNRAA